MVKQQLNARRVVVYEAEDGWRWRAQGGNWRTIDASEEGKRSKKRVLTHVAKLFPGVEIVEQ
jgi:predicted type IV restriction endonuclease